MDRRVVTAQEFRENAERFIDEAAAGPVFIETQLKSTRVLLDIAEYERLTAIEERGAKLEKIAAQDHEQFGSLYEKLAK